MALSKADKTWIEGALARALAGDEPEPEPELWMPPNIDEMIFEGGWSTIYDERSGGRIPGGIAKLRGKLFGIARGRVTHTQRQRANQLLTHPLLTSWVIATDTPVADNKDAEFQRFWNAGPLDDIILPGASFDRSRLNETDWRTLGPGLAKRYMAVSGGADPVGSIQGCFVYEKMTGSDVVAVLNLFADQWLEKGPPPPTSWDERFRPR